MVSSGGRDTITTTTNPVYSHIVVSGEGKTYVVHTTTSEEVERLFSIDPRLKTKDRRQKRRNTGERVRVANELGAGKGREAKFATEVAVTQSIVIGLIFWILIIFFHNELALIFTTSKPVLEAVHKLVILLAFTVLLNSVQPILSGVAVGSGWQAYVAYINLGCYYLLGVPLGFIMSWGFHYGVMGIWAGMIFGGTAVQTLILAIITIRCDWTKEAEKASMHVRK
ncbi:putative clathrin assembly protein-like [Capsicum annuum]|nr:putative clathrin assembly protein-like [Capsicum annuum]KAF3675174.1 putative clathrin assembly protein-like [Capsicum annuum]